jgi:hypothetical protein
LPAKKKKNKKKKKKGAMGFGTEEHPLRMARKDGKFLLEFFSLTLNRETTSQVDMCQLQVLDHHQCKEGDEHG